MYPDLGSTLPLSLPDNRFHILCGFFFFSHLTDVSEMLASQEQRQDTSLTIPWGLAAKLHPSSMAVNVPTILVRTHLTPNFLDNLLNTREDITAKNLDPKCPEPTDLFRKTQRKQPAPVIGPAAET